VSRIDMVTQNGDLITICATEGENAASLWVTRVQQFCDDPSSQVGIQALLRLGEVRQIIDVLEEIAGD
jgi:hypothetical protein